MTGKWRTWRGESPPTTARQARSRRVAQLKAGVGEARMLVTMVLSAAAAATPCPPSLAFKVPTKHRNGGHSSYWLVMMLIGNHGVISGGGDYGMPPFAGIRGPS